MAPLLNVLIAKQGVARPVAPQPAKSQQGRPPEVGRVTKAEVGRVSEVREEVDATGPIAVLQTHARSAPSVAPSGVAQAVRQETRVPASGPIGPAEPRPGRPALVVPGLKKPLAA